MKLRYDPYQVFQSSKTPAGLYARQKWLGEADNQQWKNDFQETVSALLADQLPNGSWNDDPMATIRSLFGLHLTVRTATEKTDAGLNWLLDKICIHHDTIHLNGEFEFNEAEMRDLPFVPGRSDMLLTGASLFLASIFGRENDPTVLAVYRWLSKQGVRTGGHWSDQASFQNIFRAMVVHPVYAKDKATEMAVETLAATAVKGGGWGDDLTFYRTLNALAHLHFSQAESQLEKAFKLLFETQNGDGSWSRSEPEWNTFLAVHALRNKGYL